MLRLRLIAGVTGLILCVVLGGCGGTNQFGSGTQNNGNSNVVLAMTDSAPSGVSILSAEVTLTGATLTPGNVSLFSGSTTVELTRLQTDVAYIATATKIPAGPYTSVKLTFANPLLTIENDTGSPIVSGTTTCNVGSICTIAPTSTSNLSATVLLPSFSIASSSTTGLLIDVNLGNLLTATVGEDFSAGTSVFPFTPGGTGAPPVGAEDVVGHVANVSPSTNTFTLTNAEGSYALKADNTTTFFPSSICAISSFACLQNNQILSVDIGIQSDGSLLARNIVFEDADSSDAEVEGIVTSTNAMSSQFSMVVLTVSGSGTGLNIGAQATVQYSTSLPTPFDVDLLHADKFQITTSSLSSFFNGPAELVAGQQVSIQRNGSSTSVLMADRVRLRSSRVTANVQSVGAPNIILASLPFLFSRQGNVVQILAQTSVTPPTIYYDIEGSFSASTNIVGDTVSVRGPLFNTGGANRTLVATKVVLQRP
jgi:hypothetical protein